MKPLVFLLAFYCSLAYSGQITVRKACSQPISGSIGQKVLVEVECPTHFRCYPDPDDMELFNVEQKRPTGYISTRGEVVNDDGEVIDSPKKGEKFIAVLDFSSPRSVAPKSTAMLFYEGELLSKEFKLNPSCNIFSKSVLDAMP